MSLIATRTQEFRLKNPNIDKNMARMTEWGAYDFFLSQTNAMDSMLSDETKRRAFASMGSDINLEDLCFRFHYDTEHVFKQRNRLPTGLEQKATKAHP